PGCLGRQRRQMNAGRFVGAVLAPHHREDAELDEVGLAVQEPLDAAIFLVGEAVLADDFGRDGAQSLSPESIQKSRFNSAEIEPSHCSDLEMTEDNLLLVPAVPNILASHYRKKYI